MHRRGCYPIHSTQGRRNVTKFGGRQANLMGVLCPLDTVQDFLIELDTIFLGCVHNFGRSDGDIIQ